MTTKVRYQEHELTLPFGELEIQIDSIIHEDAPHLIVSADGIARNRYSSFWETLFLTKQKYPESKFLTIVVDSNEENWWEVTGIDVLDYVPSSEMETIACVFILDKDGKLTIPLVQ